MLNFVVFISWVICLAPFIFHLSMGVGVSEAWNRVFITFDKNTDRCKEITPQSNFEAKEAANSACARAFEALDQVKENFCSGWRLAECRKLREYDHLVCSCIFSSCTYYGIKTNGLSSFRDCAWNLYQEEYHTGRTPAPSANFKRKHEKIYDDAKEKSRRGKVGRTSYEAGPSHAPCGGYNRNGNIYGGGTGLDILAYVADTSHGSGFAGTPVNSQEGYAGDHVCALCGKSYSQRQSLLAHQKSHTEDIRCPVCNKPYSTRANCKHHLVTRHPEVIEDEKESPPIAQEGTSGLLVCEVCGMTYKRQSSLSAHRAVHRVNLKCRLCDLDFSNKPNFKRHLTNTHPELLESNTDNPLTQGVERGAYVCDVCDNSYHSRDGLMAHKKAHRENIRCIPCKQTFSNRANFKRHNINTHPEIAKAEERKEAEAKAARLKEHPHICYVCNENFSSQRKLLEHMPLHKGEFKCYQCDRTFPRRSELTKHNKNHHR